MVLVRQVFQTQVGGSHKLAAMIMQGAAQFGRIAGSSVHGRVLTDISGPFGTVVLEIEVESLADWERIQAAMSAHPEGEPGSSNGTPTIAGGYQEFYTLEGTF